MRVAAPLPRLEPTGVLYSLHFCEETGLFLFKEPGIETYPGWGLLARSLHGLQAFGFMNKMLRWYPTLSRNEKEFYPSVFLLRAELQAYLKPDRLVSIPNKQ